MTDYRSDFPLLTSRGFRKDVGMEHDWIYIDNAATSQRPQAVLDAEEEFYKEHNANPLRAIIPLALKQRRCMKMPVRQCVILLEQNR